MRAFVTLTVPGWGNSPADHWQSRWEAHHANVHRVHQRNWDEPDATTWCDQIVRTVDAQGSPVVLAAHSMGCLAVALCAARVATRVRGALLVAPPDVNAATFPAVAAGFRVQARGLPFASVVVASANDPYGSLAHAQGLAAAWGSRLEQLGNAGHINAASGLGDWPAGWALVEALGR